MTGRKLAALSLTAIFVLAAVTLLVLCYEENYTEAEITPELCVEIVQQNMQEERPVQIAGIQKVDDSIIVGYAVGNEYQAKTFGYLQFVHSDDSYELYCNQTKMLDILYSDTKAYSFTTGHGTDDLLQTYYVILGCDDDLQNIEVWESKESDYQLWQRLAVGDGVFMCIWERPHNGKYLLLGENDEELGRRYFTRETQTVTADNGDSLTLYFDIDYADVQIASRSYVNCRVTLAEMANAGGSYVRSLTLNETSRPHTAWNEIMIDGMAGSSLFGGRLSAEIGQCLDDLSGDIDIPQTYDDIAERESYRLFMQNPAGYVRSVQVRTGSGFHFDRSGQYFNVIGRFSDYANQPDGDVLPENNELKVEWRVEIGSKANKETQTCILEQEVPIAIMQ